MSIVTAAISGALMATTTFTKPTMTKATTALTNPSTTTTKRPTAISAMTATTMVATTTTTVYTITATDPTAVADAVDAVTAGDVAVAADAAVVDDTALAVASQHDCINPLNERRNTRMVGTAVLRRCANICHFTNGRNQAPRPQPPSPLLSMPPPTTAHNRNSAHARHGGLVAANRGWLVKADKLSPSVADICYKYA